MELAWEQLLADCVAFTQRLIQTPSMPGEEGPIGELVVAEMRRLGFDEVWRDGMGNVNGRIRGADPSLGALVLNAHLDHVDPGDPALWSVPPFSGEIVDGRIIGRGAVDIKGPLAVQVYSMAALLRAGLRPRRDVVFTGVVQEEVGGDGAIYWVEHLDYPVDLVVLGEPSDNKIALGHRGGVWLWLKFYGRSAHASAPERGQNPNYPLGEFLHKLQMAKERLSSHPLLGKTTVSPTIIEVDTRSQNVIPAWARLMLDFRTASESMNSLKAFVTELAGDWPHSLSDGLAAEPDVPLPDSDEPIFGFYTPPEEARAQRAQAIISRGAGYDVPFSSYRFATDGRHFTPYNLTMIGYAPGDESQAHVADESISIAGMGEALRGYTTLLREY